MIAKMFNGTLLLIGLLLPWRLRILYSEILGWITQLVYFTYYGIFNFILSELRKAESENKNE